MSLFNRIGEWIKNLLHQLPQEINDSAKQALHIMLKVSDWLKSDKAQAISELIAHDQSERLAIIAILETLEAALEAIVSPDDKKAIMAKRGALITSAIHGGTLPQNVYDMAFQATYSESKATA